MVKGQPGRCPSSAPVPPQGAPGGFDQLGTPRKRPAHWAPCHCLECSSWSPPKPPRSPPSTVQVAREKAAHEAHWTHNLPPNVSLQGVPEKKLRALSAWEADGAAESKNAPRQDE